MTASIRTDGPLPEPLTELEVAAAAALAAGDLYPDGLGPAEAPDALDLDALDADALGDTLTALDSWVEGFRAVWSLPVAVVPPYWHRHDSLVWLLASLWQHRMAAFDPDQHASAPFGFWRDFEEWKHRMREQVAATGTRADQDRPDRAVLWPGQPPSAAGEQMPPVDLSDRRRDFHAVLAWRVARRRAVDGARLEALASRLEEHQAPDAGGPDPALGHGG
ncbi:MAG: hypothetical protein LBK95_09870 [Bifidobacteriaceae bacterium]|jgi:hypothetical protein|nr:hypothetical protein [Bifidobacteriaceae bacterium]